MIRVPLTARSLGHSRFAVSPMSEAVDSVRLLQDPGRAPHLLPWVRRARGALRGTDVTLLRALVPDPTAYVPDFLTPPPTSADRTLDDDLASVVETPAERVRDDLESAYGRDLPDAVRSALADGERAFTRRAAAALRRYWEVALEPEWPVLRAILEDDILHRARLLAREGAAATLSALHRDIGWDGACLHVAHERDLDVEWAEEGLLFSPSVFGGPFVYVLANPAVQPVVYHPARGAQRLGEAAAGPRDPAPAELVGTTRSALFADLADPRTTGELAARLDLAPSTVSYHLGILVRAGLVDRTRRRRHVLYQRRPSTYHGGS